MHKDETLLSIIIPVFNVEKYIEKNILSVLRQCNAQIEAIYVDDGSQDHSIDIVKELTCNCDYIRIVHQKNGGLSAARNYGLSHARGKYVVFLDSDDYYEDKNLQDLINEAETKELDVLYFNYRQVDEYGKTLSCGKEIDDQILSGKEWLIRGDLVYPAWSCIIKRELLLTHEISFRPGLLHEDVIFMPELLVHCNRVSANSSVLYNYVKRPNSIMAGNYKKRIEDLLQITFLLEEEFIDWKDSELYEKFSKNYLAYVCLSSIRLAIFHGYDLKDFLNIPSTNQRIVKILKGGKNRRYHAVLIEMRLYKIYKILFKLENLLHCLKAGEPL